LTWIRAPIEFFRRFPLTGHRMKRDPAPDMLPKDTRPRAFAGVELLLDLLHIARSVANLDLESVVIYYCISEASMRPLVLGPDVPEEVRRAVIPPEEYRGAISRLLIADRTGLPRETVRRKTNALLKAGLLTEDDQGRVRTTRNLDNPMVRKAADDAFAAVRRYDARLRQLGSQGVSGGDPEA
jgi:DNA-binding transcriptional ArsR family regulator